MSYNKDGLAFFSDGNLNQSVDWQGSSAGDYLTFPNKEDVTLFSGEFSLCCRVYLTGNNTEIGYPLLHMTRSGAYTPNYFLIYNKGFLKLSCEDSAGNSDTLISSLALNLNSWVNIVARVTSSNFYLYDDTGSDSFATSYYPYLTEITNDLHVFRDGRTANDFYSYGKTKDICLYNYDIGAGGAQVFLNGGIPGVPSLYAPINDGSGTALRDYSRNKQDGTAAGAGSWNITGTAEEDKRFF